MAQKYCPECQRNVTAKKKFSFLFFLITGCIPYTFYYVFLKRRECPICARKL